jgi:hypothetical protein
MKKNSDLKSSMIVKINFLLLALGLTVYFIYSLQTRGLPPALQAFFGMPANTTVASQVYQFSWCDTRVESIIKPEEFKLTQDGRNWLLENPTQRVADFISVEKWFGRHCQIHARSAVGGNDQDFTPELFVKFVTGEVQVLKRNAAGLFSWRGKVFESPELTQAIEQIPQLPEGVRR